MRFNIRVIGDTATDSRSISITSAPSVTLPVRTVPVVNQILQLTGATIDPQTLLDRYYATGLELGDSTKLGSYLFDALIGPDWTSMKAHTPAGDSVEIELQLDAGDAVMQSLPWEMMVSPDGRLATCAAPRTTFARVIAPAKPYPAPVFTAPFRILFVVGSQLNNLLRPGAELMGLLRRPEFDISGLSIRYIGEADYEVFQRAVSEFRPSLIHLVCHGQMRTGSPPEILLLQREATGRLREYPVTATRLIDLMQQPPSAAEPDGWIPPAVVLSACYSGTFSSAHLSFAASLVSQGVAMSIGMAGEVADRACQAFTLRFYQALITQQPIAWAVAQGRRAALLKYPELEESIEWTRPTLFLREGISTNLPIPKLANIELVKLAPRLRRVGKVPRALSARYAALQCYQDLIARVTMRKPGQPLPDELLLLAFTVTDGEGGVGKTRLLEEIGVRAISDLFFPVILRGGSPPPSNFLDFGLAVSDAMIDARKQFLLPFAPLQPNAAAEPSTSPQPLSAIRRLAFRKFKIIPNLTDPEAFRDQLGEARTSAQSLPETSAKDTLDILGSLQEDFRQLLHDVTAKAGGVSYRPMLLLDDLHLYDRVALSLLERMGPGGLGTDESPIPLIFTYMTTTPGGASLRQALQRTVPDAQQPELAAFQAGEEQRLAYGQLILSWKSLAPNERSKFLKGFWDRLQAKTGGRPNKIITLETGDFIQDTLAVSDALVGADLDAALKQYP